MTKGARNIHGLAATLRRLEQEAATGPCKLHPERPLDGLGALLKGCPLCAMKAKADALSFGSRDVLQVTRNHKRKGMTTTEILGSGGKGASR